MSNPVLTIITVVFNGENSIVDTLENVLSISYNRLNYIVIDGKSSDGTVDILKQYEAKFISKNINFQWISEKDKGLYDAMNKGWNLAEDNSFILFLGSGDKVLKMPSDASFDEAEIVYGNVMAGDYFFNSKIDFRLRLGNMLHHQALFVNKAVCPISPFNIEYRVYADFDFNQRLLKEGRSFRKDNLFLGYALEGGISAIYNYEEAYKIIRRNYGMAYVFLAKVYYFLQRNIRMRFKK